MLAPTMWSVAVVGVMEAKIQKKMIAKPQKMSLGGVLDMVGGQWSLVSLWLVGRCLFNSSFFLG